MPRDHGYDSVETQHALEKGEVDVFVSMGGNFAAAGSDTAAWKMA